MKKLILSSILLSITFCGFSQVIFNDFSFTIALQRSKETGKLLFLQYESLNCNQCNEVANKAFDDPKLGELINQIFVCLKISPNHPDRNNIASLYNKNDNSFGTMFIAPDGTLLHNYPKTTTFIKSYEEEVDKALTKAGEGMRVSELEKEYKSGNKSLGLMEHLMQTKKSLRLETDNLLDEYVLLLPVDSLKSTRVLVFIIGMTPVLESKAYLELVKAYELLKKKTFPSHLPFHRDVNNRIANKSLQKAIAEKNESYALRIAGFAKGLYALEPEKAEKVYASKIIEFYDETKNTGQYLNHALDYYEKYFMTISVDSVRKQDTINMNELGKKQPFTTEKRGDALVMSKAIRYSSLTQTYANELKNAARKIYQITDNTVYLTKALNWSRRANEFFENYNTLNTYALLQYKTGNKIEAVKYQEKAIFIKKKMGLDYKNLENELSGMK